MYIESTIRKIRDSRALFFVHRTMTYTIVFTTMSVPAFAQSDHYPQILRYNEDYTYLADSRQKDDAFDDIKYVPLDDDDPTFYLSLHGEARERLEVVDSPQLGLTSAPSDTVLQHRLLLGADLHLGRSVRVFTQLGAHAVSGRKGGATATDKDKLDLQQAFIDITQPIGARTDATLRLGRQEMILGSGRLVAVREGPNVRRSFDGARAMIKAPDVTISVFATRPVRIKPGIFDDPSDDSQALWGVYSTSRITEDHSVDLYYLGFKKDHAVYANAVGPERRHSLGARLFGKFGAMDYNAEGVWQFGTVADDNIRAYTVAFDGGYSLTNLPMKPRLGIKANVQSGDKDPTDDRLQTFNPIYPNHAYFSEAGFGAPMNGYDVQPNITLNPAPYLSIVVGTDFFWRYSKHDAVYSSILLPLPNTAQAEGRYIGTMFTSHVRWRPTRHWEFNLDYSRISAGEVIRNAGGSAASLFMASAAYRF